MVYGEITLQPVYNKIKQISGKLSKTPPIPKRGTPQYRDYSDEFMRLIQNVPGDKAVYLWYAKNITGELEFIYVGESHKNQNGLRGRFTDEFKQWYHKFWMTAFKSDRYERDVIMMYNTPSKDYTKEVLNVSRKKGATHIVYCSHSGVDFEPVTIQNDLIQLFNNPRGNAKDIRRKPLTDDMIHPQSKIIYDEFNRCAQNDIR